MTEAKVYTIDDRYSKQDGWIKVVMWKGHSIRIVDPVWGRGRNIMAALVELLDEAGYDRVEVTKLKEERRKSNG